MDLKNLCTKLWAKRKYIFTALKYLYSFALIIYTYRSCRNVSYVILGEIELLCIFLISNLLVSLNRHFNWLNSLLILILNAEYTVLYFGGSYVTYVMLENINSVRDLEGRAFAYTVGVLGCIICSFFPITEVKIRKKFEFGMLGISAILEICAIICFGAKYSPTRAVYGLVEQWSMQRSLYSNAEWDGDDTLETFHNDGIIYEVSGQSAYSCNISQPNIILIFTEGLSESVVQDERNIMPNVSEYQNNSLNFVNYYNHTFATYRGIIGQLYSGHQRDDDDLNYLISLQSIMRDQGYWTTMINTEPFNKTFTSYLENMGFDEVISDKGKCDGAADSLSDKTAYEMLFDTAIAYNEQKNQPFFITIYTFGTHASLDTFSQIYGDGADRVLNRFYNADYQFGEFMNKFNNSSLPENTIVVFTADHATYADQDFLDAFPQYERACSDVDEIPFFIYSAGGPVANVDAEGRNSLDMAPTLLHYLNVNAPNYFLGNSLFYEKKKGLNLDTYFWDPTYIRCTDQDQIIEPNEDTQLIIYDAIRKYFSVSSQASLEK
ncbi:MAG: LTA synthase family protein [Agathobacter sp.]